MIVYFADEVHPRLAALLNAAGYSCVDAFEKPPEELALLMRSSACGMIIRSRFPVNELFLRSAGALAFVARFGSGMENIDGRVAHELGIRLFSCPEGNSDAVADHTIGLMLGVMKKITLSNRGVVDARWEREPNRGDELYRKTVAIFGYGNAGRAVVKRLAGFDCEVLVSDPYVNLNGLPSHARPAAIEEIYEQAEVVSMHVSLSAETRAMASASFFNAFRNPLVFINTSRGPVTDSAALLQALHHGRVCYAGLDVLDVEDSSFEDLKDGLRLPHIEALRKHPHCLITPHIAGWSHQSNERMCELLSGKITAAFG